MFFFINIDSILQRLSGNVGDRLEMVAERGSGVPLFRHPWKPPECGSEQLALCVTAGPGLGPG